MPDTIKPIYGKLFPELAGKLWRYFDLNYLSTLQYPEDQYKENPLLDAKFCENWVRLMHQMYMCDYSYDRYGGDRRHLWRETYLTKDYHPHPHDPVSGLKTRHLGIDFNVPAGTPVHAPQNCVVIDVLADSDTKLGWGGRVIVDHPEWKRDTHRECLIFGHLAHDSLPKVDQEFKAGEQIGVVGNYPENGNVWPHLHVQQWNLQNKKKARDIRRECKELDGYGLLAIDYRYLFPEPFLLLIA